MSESNENSVTMSCATAFATAAAAAAMSSKIAVSCQVKLLRQVKVSSKFGACMANV